MMITQAYNKVNVRRGGTEMDKWLIAADSSCDLPSAEFGRKVPFIISAGERDFIDTEELDTSAMLEYIEACKDAAHTSCPAPGAWLRLFEQAENTVAVTISRKFSGSYASAAAAREVFLEQHPDRNVLLINSRSTGPALSMIVHRARELVDSGADFELINIYLKNVSVEVQSVGAYAALDKLKEKILLDDNCTGCHVVVVIICARLNQKLCDSLVNVEGKNYRICTLCRNLHVFIHNCNVSACLHVLIECLLIVNICNEVAGAHQNILFLTVIYVASDAVDCFNLVEGTVCSNRRQNCQT